METKNSSSINDVWFVILCNDVDKDSYMKLIGCLDSFSVNSYDIDIIPIERILKNLIVFRCPFNNAQKFAGVLQSLRSHFLVYNYELDKE